jgi:hypothetical protein
MREKKRKLRVLGRTKSFSARKTGLGSKGAEPLSPSPTPSHPPPVVEISRELKKERERRRIKRKKNKDERAPIRSISTFFSFPQVIKTNILASRAKQYELNFKSSMLAPRLYKPIGITCGLMFFQRFSGANAFNYYAVNIFRQTLSGTNPHGATIAIGFVQLLASLLSGTRLF